MTARHPVRQLAPPALNARFARRLRPFVPPRTGGWACPCRDLAGPIGEQCSRVESGCGAVAVGRACLFPPLSSGGALVARPWLRFHIPLIGRVENWRAGLGRSLGSLLSRSFVCECPTISTMPRLQPPPRRTQRADFPHCAPPFASHQSLWDLSYWGDFRPVASHSIGVEQP